MRHILISELTPDILTNDIMTKLLFEGIADDGKNSDCIFVFGSDKATHYRVPKAVDLYNQQRASTILFSGGVKWKGSPMCESLMMRQKAMELGVPETAILTETRSKHTKENVLSSLVVLDRRFMLHNMKRIIIVTSAYHMRRSYLTMKTYMPRWIEFSLCPVPDQTTTIDNWWLHESGTKRVLQESRKLIEYVRMGALEDAVI